VSRHPLKIGHTVTVSDQKGFSLGHTLNINDIEVRVGDGSTLDFGNITHDLISESTYYHRIFTINRNSGCLVRHHLNGVYVGQLDAPTVTGEIYDPSTSDLGTPGNIGFGYVWGWRFIGSVNIIKIYNKILTESEIQQNYTTIRSRFDI